MGEREDSVGVSTDELRYRADPSETASEAVVSAITAVVRDTEFERTDDVTSLPPLYDAVDADAMNQLFDPPWNEGDAELSITFVYAGYRVHIDDTGLVVVTDCDDRN
ncbi:HalOD1 output domain-containing protein [Halorussus sp. MSC15.2]|uniref:HalOD1 output domain-containing protein n=1 Tax=Halorussus sp. MSC15.2 TaxID=2283638 RepID=UPI0013D8DA33|nr:HalOD1 output domain-containing protein [Halorussus sp. MSC15.2]NEU56205.1 hypothetical protein [Halorussus sp. MSC15.2]